MSASGMRGRLQRLVAGRDTTPPALDPDVVDAELAALMGLPEVERDARIDEALPGWRDA